jgi:hypothetical protein
MTKARGYVGPVTGTQYTASRARGLADYSPQATRQRLLDDILGVLREYLRYWPLTVRQIGYRLLRIPRYDKSEAHFGAVGEVVNRARRHGLIRWEAIRDDNVVESGDEGYDGLGGL